MGDRESHAPGMFSWASVGAADPAAVVPFYERLFGWQSGDGGFTLDGKKVAGVHEGAAGWASYVTVEDVDAATARARELGGAADESGVKDPTGATVRLTKTEGAERVNDPGCMVWNELATPDPDRARTFYAGLLGWTAEPDDSGYATIKLRDAVNGGIRPVRDGEPPQWLVYFTVPSLDETARAAAEAGGKIAAGPFTIASGRIALVTDPQGATFAVYEGQPDP